MVRTRSSKRLTRKPDLPLDVCGIIIDILASDRHDPGLNSVKKCSLVCQSFLPLCRKHIFATIKIDDPPGTLEPSHSDSDDGHSDSDEGPHHVLEEFMELIKHTPGIGNYIHHLELSFEEYDDLDDFPRTMQCLTRLESLTISQCNELFDWRSLKWPVRNAPLRLLQLPTLTTLALCFVSNFLVTDLVHGTNLRRLELKSTTFFEDPADAPPYGCYTAQILFPVHMPHILLIYMYFACSHRLIHLNFDFTKCKIPIPGDLQCIPRYISYISQHLPAKKLIPLQK